ncbi:tetratricopeptide repeat protein [Lysobacter korlensis]|uniref:Tetratricopeptide repeat protein n=1 Tax=Lysobacter korlensis TaxID=553636 RepID=A0ABV6S0I3_9GAMM
MPSPATALVLTAAQLGELQSAFTALQSGHHTAARAIAERLAQQVPSSPDAHHLLALTLCASDPAAADASFRTALALAPHHPLISGNYANLLRKTRRFDEALVVLQRAVDAVPDSPKLWLELGITARAADLHEHAILAIRRAVALDPNAVPAWLALGHSLRTTGELDDAEAAFRAVLARQPDDRVAMVNLGAVLRLSGRPVEAVACFESVIRTHGWSAELADALAGALLDSGRVDEAICQARAVVTESPEFVPGLVTLATMVWEYGSEQAEDSSALFDTALARQPDNLRLRAAFAQFLLAARRPEEALAHIRMMQARSPDPEVALLEADALGMLGELDKAGVLYEQLYRSLDTHSANFLNVYARHLLRTGRYDAAAQVATEATGKDPGNQEAWAYLGTAWRLLDDPRERWLCDYERHVALVDVEPPAGCADPDCFLASLEDVLDTLHKARRAPLQQSVRGGSQTPGRLFGRPEPLLAATRDALLRAVEGWLSGLPVDDRHPFLRLNRGFVRIGGSWSVKLQSSGRHANHIHPEGWLSSAFYVALPPSVRSGTRNEQAGWIQFGQPPIELELGLPPRRVIRPEAGKLALFPSFVWHGTVPFEDAHARTTIAFDMLARAKGNSDLWPRAVPPQSPLEELR